MESKKSVKCRVVIVNISYDILSHLIGCHLYKPTLLKLSHLNNDRP